MTLADAARQFFGESHAVVPLGASSGYSGSAFARVEALGRSWCVRRWPEAVTMGRLRAIHRVLIHSRANGFAGVPALATSGAGDTALELGGAVYDAQEWVRGTPLGGRPEWAGPVPNVVQPLPEAQMAALAVALAQFHRSTADLRPTADDDRTPLARRLADALAALDADHARLADAIRHPDYGGDRALARRWLDLLPRALTLTATALGAYPESASDVATVCHGDLWAAHIYADGGVFSGFVDYESLSWSAPTVDVAQLLAHFDGWGLRDAAERAYAGVVPLPDDVRAMLPVAAVVDLTGEGLWAVDALADARCSPAHGAAHSANLAALFPALEAAVKGLAGR